MALITSTPGSTSALGFRSEVVLFGDSITQEGHYESGWGVLLQKYYRRRADVLNRGYGGYNTRRALAALPYVFPPDRQYLLSTVFWGANDSVSPTNALQHVPVDEFRLNLQMILEAALSVSRVVVVITPPPVDSARWPDRSVEQVAAYAKAAHDAAATINSSLLSVSGGAPRLFVLDSLAVMLDWTPTPSPGLEVAPGAGTPVWHALLSDGLHLSPTGNAVLAGALTTLLDSLAVCVAPTALTLDLPVWREVGNDQPPQTPAALSAPSLATFHASAQVIP